MGLAEIFGRNVRRMRQTRGLSLEALAEASGLTDTYLGQVERGQRNPSLGIVEKLAAGLRVDPAVLMTPDP